MNKYKFLCEEHPELQDCFYAFSDEQLKEGLDKFNLKIDQVMSFGYGLVGTKAGIDAVLAFYEDRNKRIREQCTPQEVYAYEFNNHECSYIGDDREAYMIVEQIFGEDEAKSVKRKHARP